VYFNLINVPKVWWNNHPVCDYYLQLEIGAETARAGLWSDNIFQPRSQVDWDNTLPVIDWLDTDNYYNQYVIVEGIIVDTYNSHILNA
jgi:hypothetical protein